jgi:putative hydrolase of the HAD superfamily
VEPAAAVIFDLGDTLIEYEGLPLNWEAHYPEALQALATCLRSPRPRADQIEAACVVLRRYNTRLNPRESEIEFADILAGLASCFAAPPHVDPLLCARAFFGGFRQRLRCFPDTRPALAALRERGCKIGIFTDVPYGMPRELVLEDVRDSGLSGLFDLLVTSTDIGWRKPSPRTL